MIFQVRKRPRRSCRLWSILIPCLALLAAAGTLGARETEPGLSYDEALRAALHGPAVAEAEAAIGEASALEDEARSYRHPKIELDAGAQFLASEPGFVIPAGDFGNPKPLPLIAGDRYTWQTGVSIEQVLYDGGQTRRALESAGFSIEAARAGREAARRGTALALTRAYAQAFLSGELKSIAAKQLDVLEELLKQVSAMVEAEQLPVSDRYQAEAAVEAARLDLITAGARHQDALSALEALVGFDVDGVQPLIAPNLPEIPENEAIEAALAAREDLRALGLEIKALEAHAETLRSATHPVLVARGSFRYLDDSYQLHKDNGVAALGLRIPLLDGGNAEAQSAGMLAKARGRQARLQRLQRDVVRQVRQARSALQAARQAVKTAEAARRAAVEAARLARLRYKEELISNRELLDAQSEENAASRRLAIARCRRAEAAISLRLITAEMILEHDDD